MVRIALVQASASPDPQTNLEKTIPLIERAAGQGARIICLQELFRSLYFPQTEDSAHFKLAESIPGPSTEALSRVAARHNVVIIASLFEKRAAGVYHNTAVVLDADGSIAGKYRKMHVPDDPHFYEKFYFTPGDLGFQTIPTRYGRIGVLICWDQWFPEAARLTALSGAQILFYPTAIGWMSTEPPQTAKAQQNAWEIVQRSHAVTNGIFLAAANRVGREGELTFWGSSFVCAPSGELIAKADEQQEEILLADCDFSKIDEMRESWPFLRDRRVDAYSPLTSRLLDEYVRPPS